MRTEATFSVDFVMRKKKSDPHRGYIYARIRVDGDIKELSLKEEVSSESWIPGSECLKGRAAEVQKINNYIEDVRSKIRQKYRELHDSGKRMSADLVKQAYLGKFIKKSGHTLNQLTAFHRKINTSILAKGTMKNYGATEKYFKNFLTTQLHRDDIFLIELDYEFLTEFEHYVRNNPIKASDPCVGNGVIKHLQRLRGMVSWAKKLKWIEIDPLEDYTQNPKKPKRKKLDLYELMRIEQHQFHDSHLAYIRDLFIFSCYTGLAYTDVITLTKEDFTYTNDGTLFIMTYRNKSDELSPVPSLRKAVDFIEKYVNHPKSIARGTIFP